MVPAGDVVRLFLPDPIVFTVSLLTLIIDIVVVVKLKPGDDKRAAAGSGESTTEENEITEVEARHVPTDSERGTFSPLCTLHLCIQTSIVCVFWEVSVWLLSMIS